MLTNTRAERVRSVRRLASSAGRARAGAFLAEGPQAVREALTEAETVAGLSGSGPGSGSGSSQLPSTSPPRVREVYLTDAAAERHPELAALADLAGVPVRACTPEVLGAIASATTPQGVVAVCDLRVVPLAAALARQPALVAVLAGVADPGNAGTVLRTADAAGAGAVVLTDGSTDAHGPKCVRSAAGSTFHVDVVQGGSLPDVIAALKRAGLVVLAADGGPDERCKDLDDLLDQAAAGTGPLCGPAAWVFGNEAHGLADEHRALADHVVRVPLLGRAESLSVGAAAAVCLYASARGQRQSASHRGHTGPVSERPGR